MDICFHIYTIFTISITDSECIRAKDKMCMFLYFSSLFRISKKYLLNARTKK